MPAPDVQDTNGHLHNVINFPGDYIEIDEQICLAKIHNFFTGWPRIIKVKVLV